MSRDYAEARRWYDQAANAGNARAMVRLAKLYLDGNGVQRDIVEAHTWFARAAEQGHLRAEESLATLRKIMTDSQLKEARTRLGRG